MDRNEEYQSNTEKEKKKRIYHKMAQWCAFERTK